VQNHIEIENRNVGSGCPVFVIAEAGVNHNGDIELAKQLVCQAKRVGADCVKFQTFKAERVVTKNAEKADYQLKTTDPRESQLEMLRKLELNTQAYHELIRLCRKEGIVFLSTPYNIEDVDFLDDLGVGAFKLASIHVAEQCFLQYVACKGKPMILSTGMATLDEVALAVSAIRETGNEQLVLLQCTTNYPSRLQDANLRAMQTLADSFDTIAGYSDHTQNDIACVVSVGLGACVIEKHFTLDKTFPGPDQSSSADPAEFERLVESIRQAEVVLGSYSKEPCELERANASKMRRSIVTNRKIRKGEVISADMLTFKRPSGGIKPASIREITGRVAMRDIKTDQILSWDMCGDKYRHDDIQIDSR
jgi:N-acetylneuraminate synthase/N,N'-diacetyllegionaminate synthase